MNHGHTRRSSFGPPVACALLAILQGCAASQDATPITWNSAKLREIEKEWQSLWEIYEKSPEQVEGKSGKEKYGNTAMLVDRLFRKRLSENDLRQLAASSEMVPARADDRSRFVNELLPFMVRAFVRSEDRECLVQLLSKRCPSRVDWGENIEFYLAFRGKNLEDPTLILGEAYSRCQVPETRHDLAAAVRRGFAGFGIPGKDDDDYVKNAMRWYQKEKRHLIVNEKYPANETTWIFLTIELYEEHPEFYDNPPRRREALFIRKP